MVPVAVTPIYGTSYTIRSLTCILCNPRSCPLRHYDVCVSHEETGESLGNLPSEVSWPTWEALWGTSRIHWDSEVHCLCGFQVLLNSWLPLWCTDFSTARGIFGEMDGHVCNALESIRVPCNSTSGVLKLGFINTLIMDEKMCSIAHFREEDFHQISVAYKIQKWFGTVL